MQSVPGRQNVQIPDFKSQLLFFQQQQSLDKARPVTVQVPETSKAFLSPFCLVSLRILMTRSKIHTPARKSSASEIQASDLRRAH